MSFLPSVAHSQSFRYHTAHDPPIPIVDVCKAPGGGAVSSIVVPDAEIISKVTVELELAHGHNGNVIVRLRHEDTSSWDGVGAKVES